MTTDKGITFAVIAVAVVAMFALNTAMARFDAASPPVGVSAETTASIPR